MLIYASDLLNLAVLSLRTGDKIASIDKIIINPFDLTIQAFKLSGHQLDKPKDSYLLPNDIREISKLGVIIDDSEEIVSGTDIIKLREILDLGFSFNNLPVIDRKRRKLGKVIDYTITNDYSFIVYQLVVKRPLLKGILDPELLIHRSQIFELSQTKVVVKNSFAELKQQERDSAISEFVNPFRQKSKSN